jgi:hypothetical protein
MSKGKGGFEQSTETDWQTGKSGQDNSVTGPFQGHKAGARTTKHRPIETARLQADAEGAHPEHGQFSRQFDPDAPSDQYSWQAPSGASVTVNHNFSQPPTADPDDQQVTVNGQSMFRGQANVYLKRTRGIQI